MADATKIGVADATKMGVANARVANATQPKKHSRQLANIHIYIVDVVMCVGASIRNHVGCGVLWGWD